MSAKTSAKDLLIQRAAKKGRRGPNSRGEYSVCCPFCERTEGKADTKFKLQLNPAKGVYHCYRCGHSGHADLSWLEKPDVEIEVKQPKESLGPPEGFAQFLGNEGSITLKPYVDYLKGRGVYQQACEAKAGACLSGRYAGRVVVPMLQGPEWIGFSARAIYKGMDPKYLYPRGMDRTNNLWGMHTILTDQTWVVEGVFDALPLWPHAVAAFGKNLTEAQLDKLVDMGTTGKIFVCLDGDAWEEGQVIASRLMLRGAQNVFWCRLPPGADPGTLGWKVKDFIQD